MDKCVIILPAKKFTSLIDKGGTQNPQSERQCPQDKPLAAYHADDILQPLRGHKTKVKMQKTSEIQTISEVFRYSQPAFLRRILKWRGVPKGYIANRSGDCTLAMVLNAIVQEFIPFPNLSNYSVEPAFEGTFFHRTPDCTLECTLGYSY